MIPWPRFGPTVIPAPPLLLLLVFLLFVDEEEQLAPDDTEAAVDLNEFCCCCCCFTPNMDVDDIEEAVPFAAALAEVELAEKDRGAVRGGSEGAT